MSVMTNEAMSVYINDHLADETLGLQLATRAAWQHKGTPLGTFLELLSWELEEDRESLVRLMGELGVHRRHRWSGITEKMGRLKLTGASPQRTLAELESLDRRITRKLDMWNSLRSTVGDHVDGIDFDELARRAERQSDALHRRRLDVATGASSYRDGSAPARSNTPLAVAR